MTLEYDSQSDDDGEIVVSKRKRNAILDNESDDEDTVDVLNQTNKIDDVVNGGDSMEDEPINDDSNVVSSKIRTLSKESDNESDADGSSIGGELSNNDEIEDSNQSEILSKICDNVKPIEKKYTFDPSVYDAEESDEEIRSKTPEVVSEDERICDDVQNKFPTSEKSVVKDKSSKHQNKGSKQKPSDNMREIRRESQRMVRESQVILPYHIPKQRTLAEFLNRKKSAPSIPIRTTAEQLISLSKQIQQLEKESQEFFKSDSSDGDDDGDEDYVPECDRNAKTESAQDNKTLIDGDDNEADKSRVDENFNKEKVISKSDIEEIGCGESNKDESNTKIDEKSSSVASILADVADRLQNDIVDNSLEGATQSDTVQTTSESTEIGCQISDGNRTQLSQLSTEKSYFCKKNLLISNNTDDSTNNACLETNSNQHLAEKDESDCEDFTLDLTMPEDSEMVEEVKEKDKESFTLDLTMPEDSINLLGNKEENEKKDSLVKDNKISSDCGIDNLFETKDQVNTNLYSSKKNSFSNKSKKIELLSKINVDLTKVPTLSKSFGGEINLDSPPKKSGVVDLRERFFKHYAMDRKKKKSKSPVKVSVVSAVLDGKGHVEDISKEVIRASSKPDEQWLEEIKEAELPGAKHSKLKAFLESKAKAKWKEDYEKRLQEYKMNEEEIVENDKADYEHEAILDDEDEEADMTNSEEEDDEEELEEDDVQLVDKRRKQSKFVEDEADVSEDEMEGDNGGDEDEEEEEVVEEKEEDLLGYNESDDEDSDSENRDRRKKKTKKRITERNVYNNDECEDDSENSEESESESPKRKTKLIPSDNEEKSQSMEDLGGICSGKFPTQPESFSQLDSDKLLNGFADTSSQSDGESQTFDLSLPEQSQLLDRSQEESEEEEEGTKRKKTSTLDSDDDEEEDAIVLNRSHKKRAKAVEYSDDEDEKSKPEIQNDDDLESENSEELVLDEIGNEELELEYDSEENEVVRDPKAFIEKEAELSESEWGSEDEDEKDLDKFEEEAGDQEVLDEDEVNRELGKIHMQQMLVDDKRDVRILQELLLEDGELHSDGSGRQRQFRWANADSGFAGGDPTMKDSDDDDSDQGEDEENWRKKRHERELFLNKKNARLKELGIEEEDEEDEKDDGLLGMGRALAKKMQTSSSKQPVNVTSRVSAAAVTMNCKFMAKNMRGSFLTSSEQYLSRLAHITTKVGSESNVNGPKNSRNFVFSIVSPKKEEEKEAVTEDIKLKKRKASENATNAKKKIHFSDDKGNEKRKSLLDALG